MNENPEILKRFGLITEEDLASLLGITVPSLRNRARDNLPAFTKVGRRRLFKDDAVGVEVAVSHETDQLMAHLCHSGEMTNDRRDTLSSLMADRMEAHACKQADARPIHQGFSTIQQHSRWRFLGVTVGAHRAAGA